MGILLGLTAALCWGSADFLARYSTRSIGTYRTLFFMQIFGFVGLSLYLWQSGEFERLYQRAVWQDWAWATLAALLNIISSLSLYRAFEIGILSVVSPIAASYGALTAVLSVLSGETLSITRALGIVAALLGVMLASISMSGSKEKLARPATRFGSRPGLPPGVAPALLAALCFGFIFWILGFFVTPKLGGVAPIWYARLLTLVVLATLAVPSRQSLKIPRGQVWWFIAGVGVLDTVAFVSNALGLTTDQVAVVTVLASLFSAVTVVLAWLFLREKLQWSQWLGIGIICVGIGLVSI